MVKGNRNYLSMIDGNATLHIGGTIKQFQKYQLKLSSFPLGPGFI
jgi:hypothetical protein